jgi:hypothetical protein
LQISEQTLNSSQSFESRDFLEMSRGYFSEFDFKRDSKRLIKGLKTLDYVEKYQDQTAVSEFELIENFAGQTDLVVGLKEEVEQWIKDLEKLYEKKSEVDFFSPEGKGIFGELMYLKKKLTEFTITIYQHELDKYRKTDEIREAFNSGINYIPNEKLENVYMPETGFDPNPEPKSLTTTKMF